MMTPDVSPGYGLGGVPVTHPLASFLEGPVQSLIIVHADDSAKKYAKTTI